MLHAAIKIISRHKAIFCYAVLIWGVGTLISTALLGSWGWSRDYVQQFPEPRQNLLKHHLILPPNHPKLNRAIKYCNLPNTITRGQEGNFRKGDRLEAIVIVTRHGDRGALHEFLNHSHVDCGVSLNQHADLAAFVQLLQDTEQRQEIRGPFAQFPPLPPLGKTCALGQLSGQGLLQMFRLGRQLRTAYGKRGRLFSEPSFHEQVVVYSTSVTRTYHSLLAFLYGFLPMFNMSSISVRAGLRLTFCYSPQMCDCPAIDQLELLVRKERSNHIASHPAVQELIRSLNPVVKFRVSDKDFSWPDDIFDILMVYLCHGVKLPCSKSEGVCATVDQVNNLLGFLEWSGKQVSSFGPFKRSSRLKIHGFLMDITQKLNDVKKGKKKRKVFIYSAHDVTLIPLMSVLGFYDGAKIPYASRLVFELYSSNHPLNIRMFHLRILYNGRDVTKQVSFCHPLPPHNRTAEKFTCPLNNFLHYVNRDFLKELNVASFREACTIHKKNPKITTLKQPSVTHSALI